MKKLFFTIVILGLFQSLFGQYNPINNLDWEHWYIWLRTLLK